MTLLATHEAMRKVLGEHFIMWRPLFGDGPRGEWYCECGKRFGFSETAIDHQTEALSSVVVDAATLADDDGLVERVAFFGGLVKDARRYLKALSSALTEPLPQSWREVELSHPECYRRP